MKVIDNSASFGPRGTGSIEVLNDTQVKVRIKDREGETSEHLLEYPQGVENVRIGNWKLQNASDLSISLEQDGGDFLYVPRPRNGTFYVRFARFGSEPGELPTIRHEDAKDYNGKPWLPERLKFFALYEVINPGAVEGMEILDSPTYEFEWDENLEEFTIVGSKRAKFHEHLLRFLNTFGFDLQNDILRYTAEDFEVDGAEAAIPNVLPQLEDIILSRGKLAMVTVKDGWVQEETLGPGPYGMTPESLRAAMVEQEDARAVVNP